MGMDVEKTFDEGVSNRWRIIYRVFIIVGLVALLAMFSVELYRPVTCDKLFFSLESEQLKASGTNITIIEKDSGNAFRWTGADGLFVKPGDIMVTESNISFSMQCAQGGGQWLKPLETQ
jgi:hypothetical protein